MKTHQTALIALALATLSSAAFAGRDEVLIQQTRKNQLAYEARIKQERQEKQQQQEKNTAQAPTGASGHAPEQDAGAQPVAAPAH
ncbi:hypothetical protein QPK32_08205 [Massilia sp. YIM B02763]|uniref:hypothetical protein n=1 Tax=Massilia sp. YIM B02763 TaxID=3050130 RepID=UPI0025B65D76|nr:hypothetical protein [Massilia sp. YIM B02763]MDN4053057.1 hypothetical protein [Massilia sp. YIM B02763]